MSCLFTLVSVGAVTSVRGQGICGSCYAIASTGAVEGAHFLKVQFTVFLPPVVSSVTSLPNSSNGATKARHIGSRKSVQDQGKYFELARIVIGHYLPGGCSWKGLSERLPKDER